jgi:hypothetical protein
MKLLDRIMAPWDKEITLWEVLIVVTMCTTDNPIIALVLLILLAAHTEISYRIKELNK